MKSLKIKENAAERQEGHILLLALLLFPCSGTRAGLLHNEKRTKEPAAGQDTAPRVKPGAGDASGPAGRPLLVQAHVQGPGAGLEAAPTVVIHYFQGGCAKKVLMQWQLKRLPFLQAFLGVFHKNIVVLAQSFPCLSPPPPCAQRLLYHSLLTP